MHSQELTIKEKEKATCKANNQKGVKKTRLTLNCSSVLFVFYIEGNAVNYTSELIKPLPGA